MCVTSVCLRPSQLISATAEILVRTQCSGTLGERLILPQNVLLHDTQYVLGGRSSMSGRNRLFLFTYPLFKPEQ